MRRWIGPFAVLVLTAITTHWATLNFAPSIIMDRALLALKDRGVALHAFTTPKRITPQTQAVVRSSPDMFYSLCRYDLSKPPGGGKQTNPTVDVYMAEWDGYQSLSFFDAETNNYATIRGNGTSQRVKLGEYFNFTGRSHTTGGGNRTAINSPTKRGVILIRRLAPTAEAFAKAKETARRDRCDYSQPPGIVY